MGGAPRTSIFRACLLPLELPIIEADNLARVASAIGIPFLEAEILARVASGIGIPLCHADILARVASERQIFLPNNVALI
jgi:hypothetical protein